MTGSTMHGGAVKGLTFSFFFLIGLLAYNAGPAAASGESVIVSTNVKSVPGGFFKNLEVNSSVEMSAEVKALGGATGTRVMKHLFLKLPVELNGPGGGSACTLFSNLKSDTFVSYAYGQGLPADPIPYVEQACPAASLAGTGTAILHPGGDLAETEIADLRLVLAGWKSTSDSSIYSSYFAIVGDFRGNTPDPGFLLKGIGRMLAPRPPGAPEFEIDMGDIKSLGFTEMSLKIDGVGDSSSVGFQASCPDESFQTGGSVALGNAVDDSGSETLTAPASYQGCIGENDPTHRLTVSRTGTGSGKVVNVSSLPSGGGLFPTGIDCGGICEGLISEGAGSVLSAVADSGSHFVGWSGDCFVILGNCFLGGNKDVSVAAEFEADPVLRVSLRGSGKVTSSPAGINCGSNCSMSVPPGTKVVLTAAPSPGMSLNSWDGAGGFESEDLEVYSIFLDKDEDVKANFGLTAPTGEIGVSINHGDQFTNDSNVMINPIWSKGDTRLKVSNDGGFAGFKAFDVAPVIKWKLDSSGPERLPKTVYVRFGNSIQNFTDDIILDETPPVLGAVTASSGGASSSLATRSLVSISRVSSVLLRVRASDKTSGVAKIQIGPRKSVKLKKQKFKTRLRVRTSSRKLWVRVFDWAGNASRWKSVKVG